MGWGAQHGSGSLSLPLVLLRALGHSRWAPPSDCRGRPSPGSTQGLQQPQEPSPPNTGPPASFPGPQVQTKTGWFTSGSSRKKRAKAHMGVVREGPGTWCGRWRPEFHLGSRCPGHPPHWACRVLSAFGQAGPLCGHARCHHPGPGQGSHKQWFSRAHCCTSLYPGSGFASKPGYAGCPMSGPGSDIPRPVQEV